ncbi:YVTN repeat-like/Quino protein amine dehydrogenase [Xylona heveae TC161]|uniref:YVTN repeat-like/Quino protein amine dehydrogenase n=1 Tax=Xylona heveae (strain CBS 132557 / TC161) TaxID=1328760 RepID=A0A165JDE1_XYLHT|nr:YVTN repeat-like/Quino protein amine dehydrogenase [Xylona heveae TC161]KZF26089.1 YVTN repeat-like/Quino protein amine dehydrogenase [Xylona heveae TC161]
MQSSINLPLTWPTGILDDDGAEQELEAYPFEDLERNPDVCKFLETWRVHHGLRHPDFAPVGPDALHAKHWTRPVEITRDDLQGDRFDAQGINWERLGTTRSAARQARGKLYTNYTNLRNVYPSKYAQDLPETENFFQFRRMDTTKHPSLTHFQLRNLICASSKNDVYYAGKSRVYSMNPSIQKETCVMDLTKPSISTIYPGGLRISTISASDGVLIAGGFGGEYAMTTLHSNYDEAHVEGLVSRDDKGITNHVHTFLDRFNSHPNAVFSSNDGKIRVLDCYSNRFIREHSYGYPINCSATSPDGRLRVVVGDDTAVTISDAETGETIEALRGHRDYGFACAWADDGIHVATGNQDTQVYIYDARMFRHPLQIIASEMAGVRALRFSPVGGGRRVLLMAEPADIVSVVDAESFTSKQKLDLFGEIGGISFTPDGSEFFVANTDEKFGGIMEYERVGYGAQYGMKYTRQREIEDCGDAYWDEKDFEWIPDDALSDDDRVKRAGAHRSRRGLDLGNLVY